MSPLQLKIAVLYDTWEEETLPEEVVEVSKNGHGRGKKKKAKKKPKEDREEIFEAL